MALSDFHFPEVLEKFQLTWKATDNLFAGVTPEILSGEGRAIHLARIDFE